MAEELENPTLYVRGMRTDDIEDIWDDTVLNNAYDRALKMANAEVAKRVAMKTNSKSKEDSDGEEVQEKKPKQKRKSDRPESTKKPSEWKAGMPCRAVYDEDGVEYEAFLVKIINDNDCMVKFLGYDNMQNVAISSLNPSQGDDARMRQVEEALGDEECNSSIETVVIPGMARTQPAVCSSTKKKKKKKKNNSGAFVENGDLPPLPLPAMNMIRNMSGAMPMPPPPPLSQLSGRTDSEEQAISDMLLSWYMTGYYTGLYQGIKRSQNGKRP